jgi:hypothetical protein
LDRTSVLYLVVYPDERPRSPGGGERLGFQKMRGSAARVQRMVMPYLFALWMPAARLDASMIGVMTTTLVLPSGKLAIEIVTSCFPSKLGRYKNVM